MGLAARYGSILRASWKARQEIGVPSRTPLERNFLPAALEILETPAPALPRAVLWTILVAVATTVVWAWFGRIDLVAVAPGKVIAADKAKIIQPAETGVVKRILVTDGQVVKQGQVLIELEAAATATAAESKRIREALLSTRLEAVRYDTLAKGASGSGLPSFSAPRGTSQVLLKAELRALQSQYREYQARLAALDAEIAKRIAEANAVKELATKLSETLPIAQRRADDYRGLVAKNFMSQHGYLEREQVRIENERDLAFQEARVKELNAGIDEGRRRRDSVVAEFERGAVNAKLEADKRAAVLEQDLVKARTRETQQILIAPVDGTVQQLAIHTVGGVVTPAQPLMVLTPTIYNAEIEATLENRDVGFVKAGQHAEIKVETFSFARYGTLPGTVIFVSNDAVLDEKRGLLFQARIRLDRWTLSVEDRQVSLSPGMAVSAEISTGQRRVIDFFLDPIRKVSNEGLRER